MTDAEEAEFWEAPLRHFTPAERERDEAEAECERLKRVADRACEENVGRQREFARADTAESERDELRQRLADRSYAEKGREAAKSIAIAGGLRW